MYIASAGDFPAIVYGGLCLSYIYRGNVQENPDTRAYKHR